MAETDWTRWHCSAGRRHLTGEQKRDLIAKLLKAQPETSNRQIAETVSADHKTVGKVRAELEGRGDIPRVETRTDSKGRQQPGKKRKRKLTASEIEFHEKREQREIKLRDDWLADHPDKTMADAEIAETCCDTDEGCAAYTKWWAQRYEGRDPLNSLTPVSNPTLVLDAEPTLDHDNAIIRSVQAQEEAVKRALKDLLESIDTCDDLEFLAFLATDTMLIELATQRRMHAERRLGELLNDQD